MHTKQIRKQTFARGNNVDRPGGRYLLRRVEGRMKTVRVPDVTQRWRVDTLQNTRRS